MDADAIKAFRASYGGTVPPPHRITQPKRARGFKDVKVTFVAPDPRICCPTCDGRGWIKVVTK